MRGHVQIDGYDYNVLSYTKALADKMATKTGRGSSKYSDQQNWDYFVQEDWSAGLGKVKEEDMGSVFTLGDTRRSGKAGLLPFPVPINTYGYERMPMTGSVTVGSTGTYQYLSIRVADYTPASDTHIVLRLLVKTPASDVTLGLTLHADTSSSDCTPVAGTLATAAPVVSASNIPGFQWWEYVWDLSTAKSGADVILMTVASGSVEIAVGDASTGGTTNWILSDGSSWGTHSSNTPTAYAAAYKASNSYRGFWVGAYELGLPVWFSNSTEVLVTNQKLFLLFDDDVVTGSTSYGTTVEDVSSAAFTIATASDSYAMDRGFYMCFFKENMYFYDLEDGTWTSLSVKGERVDVGGGYLWRSKQADGGLDGYIYYSADETTWTEIHVGQFVVDIKWWGDFLWFLTQTGLWRVGYGDAPLRTTTMEFSITARIEEWANKLYIIDGRDMLEFDGSTIRNISPMAESRLPGFAKGTITAFWGTNSYLYVAISASDGGRSGVYAYNGNGWTCCFLMGSDVIIDDIIVEKSSAYDQADWNIMHVGTASGYYKWSFFDTGSVPEPTIELGGAGEYFSYQPMWTETPWLYGGIKNLDKDWESIGVAVERAVATSSGAATSCSYDVSLYYKEGENDGWTLLGTESYSDTEQFTEKRFPLAARPSGLKLKVGILLQPTDNDNTAQFAPYVAANIVKYLAMLRDRWAWNLVLSLSDKQELADGSRDGRNQSQMIEDIESGVVKETGPFIFRDIDTKQYEVKVTTANMNPDELAWDKQRNRPRYTSIYTIGLEQVTTEEYSG